METCLPVIESNFGNLRSCLHFCFSTKSNGLAGIISLNGIDKEEVFNDDREEDKNNDDVTKPESDEENEEDFEGDEEDNETTNPKTSFY